MNKNYLMYGNCQTGALSYTLNKSQYFKSAYDQLPLKLIQNLTEKDADETVNAFKKADLIIYQQIGENYKFPTLSTKNMLRNVQYSVQKFSFVSLYFNGYFPHLDTFNGKTSILNQVHDYVVMLCYIKGMNQQEILDVINNENFYTKDIALEQVNQGLFTLHERERETDLKISNFIQEEYQNIKLFNQFNHPRGIIFDKLANQILKNLNLPTIQESLDSTTGLDGIMTPCYKSTYKQLNLKFSENFSLYSTVEGQKEQDEVVLQFINFYKTINKNEILSAIQSKKPFLLNMFDKYNL